MSGDAGAQEDRGAAGGRDVLGELADGQLVSLLGGQPQPPPEARRQVYEELVRRYAAPLTRLAAYLLRDEDGARDVVNDTFHDAMRYLEVHRGLREPEGVGVWLKEVVRRRAHRHVRAAYGRARPGATDEEVGRLADRSPRVLPGDDPVLRAVAERQIAEVVATLDAEQQALYGLRIAEGLTGAEIAVRLGQPAKTVSNKCTQLNMQIARRYHALLLVRGDRTGCAVLRQMLEAHERIHGQVFTAELAEAVFRHYDTCATCGKCATCRLEKEKLVWDAAPVFIPLLIASAVLEEAREHARQVVHASPVADDLRRPPSEPPAPDAARTVTGTAPARRWRNGRRARRVAAAAGGVLVVVAVVVVVLQLLHPAPAVHAQPVAASMPAIAYANGTQVLTRTGSAAPHAVAAVPRSQTVRQLTWSADRRYLGWLTRPSDTALPSQIHTTDVRTGATRTWECAAGCADVAFAGDRLYSVGDHQTLIGYPLAGGAPSTVAFTGLPQATSPANGTPGVDLLGSTADDANLLVFFADITDPAQPIQQLYRVSTRGVAAAVSTDSLAAAPGADSGDPERQTAVSPDGALLAYEGNRLGGDVCEPSDSVTVFTVSSGTHDTYPFPASRHPWRIFDVWIGPDHAVYAAAAPQKRACPSGPPPASAPGAPPQVFRLRGANTKPGRGGRR